MIASTSTKQSSSVFRVKLNCVFFTVLTNQFLKESFVKRTNFRTATIVKRSKPSLANSLRSVWAGITYRLLTSSIGNDRVAAQSSRSIYWRHEQCNKPWRLLKKTGARRVQHFGGRPPSPSRSLARLVLFRPRMDRRTDKPDKVLKNGCAQHDSVHHTSLVL